MKMSKEDFIYVWRDSSREDILNQYYYDRKDLMDTIDKAIEYIENNSELYYGDELYDEYQKILDILKGEENEK